MANMLSDFLLPYEASYKVKEKFDKFKQALKEGDKPGIVLEHTNKLLELDRSFYIINESNLRENVFTVLRDQYVDSKGTVDQARLFYAILEQWGAAASVEPEWEMFVTKTQEAEKKEQEASKELEDALDVDLKDAQENSEKAKKAVAAAKAKEVENIYTLKLLRDYVQHDELKTPVSLVYLGLLMSRMSERLRNAVIESQEWEDMRKSDPQNAEVLEYLRLLRSARSGNELRNLAGDLYRKYRKKLLYGNQDDWMFTETATLMADVRPTLRRKLEFLQHSGGESANLLSGTDQPVVDKEKFGPEGMLSWSVEFSKRSVRATVCAKAFDNAEKNPTDEKAEEASVVVDRTDNKPQYVATSTSPLLRTDADAALLNTAVLQVNDALVTLTTLFVKSDYYFSIERLIYDTKAEKAKAEAQAKAGKARSDYFDAEAEVVELFGPEDPGKLHLLSKAARDVRVEEEFDKLFELAKTFKQLFLQIPGIDLEAEEAEFKRVDDRLKKWKADVIESYDKIEKMLSTFKTTVDTFEALREPGQSDNTAEIRARKDELKKVYDELTQSVKDAYANAIAAEPEKKQQLEQGRDAFLKMWNKAFDKAIVEYTKLEEEAERREPLKAKALEDEELARAAEQRRDKLTADANIAREKYRQNKTKENDDELDRAEKEEAEAAVEAKLARDRAIESAAKVATWWDAARLRAKQVVRALKEPAAPGPDLDALLADHATSMRRVRDLLETD